MAAEKILMGVVGRPHGVRGLVRVHSYCAVPADLDRYALTDDTGRAWRVRWVSDGVAEIFAPRDGTAQKLADRGAAERLTNLRLYVDRAALPPAEDDEFYMADLIGMAAVGPDGELGRVAAVHDYGAGASLEIAHGAAPPLLVPFTRACVPEIDLAGGRVTIVPPAEVVTEREAAA